MGKIIAGVGSLFGGRKRRREQRAANEEYQKARDSFRNFNVRNFGDEAQFTGLSADDARGFDAVTGQAGTLSQAGQADMATLGPAMGYDSQGYDATGYSAAQTDAGQLLRGEDTGLTNTMRNLQVSTAGAEMAAQEADQALAASQDLAAQAGTGAGGATALAAQAAKSKAGIAADIDRQVKANEQLRAQGESELQRSQLAQENLASNFDLGQQQFNVGQDNQARQFTAQAQNRAAEFGADAANQAARFGADAQNTFARDRFAQANQMAQFNVGQGNQFALQQFDADNRFGLANMDAQNRAAQFGADAANQFTLQNQRAANQFALSKAGLQFAGQDRQYGQAGDILSLANMRKNKADLARQQATGALLGGIGALANPIGGAIGELMG